MRYKMFSGSTGLKVSKFARESVPLTGPNHLGRSKEGRVCAFVDALEAILGQLGMDDVHRYPDVSTPGDTYESGGDEFDVSRFDPVWKLV